MRFIFIFAFAFLTVFPARARQSAEDLVRDLRYGTIEARELAADAIRRRQIKKSEKALIEVLSTAKGTFRLKVMQALGAVGGKASVPPLLKLLTDPENDTRLLAVRALGGIGSSSAEKKLLFRLKDPDFEVRAEAALALGRCCGAASVKPVLQLLKDSNRVVRLAAVDALGQLKDTRALTPLVELLKIKDRSLRRHIVRAVGALEGSEKISDKLGAWLSSKDVYMRGFAAEALASRGKDDALVKKMLLLLKDEELGVRVRAVEALGVWRAVEAVMVLKDFLRDDSEILRWKASVALGQIQDPAALDALKYAAQNDENLEVRRAAADALLAITGK